MINFIKNKIRAFRNKLKVKADEELLGFIEDWETNVYIPDRNCYCHVGRCAPCSDCVDNGYNREMKKWAQEILKKHNK